MQSWYEMPASTPEFILTYAAGRALGLHGLYNTWTPLKSNVLTALPRDSLGMSEPHRATGWVVDDY